MNKGDFRNLTEDEIRGYVEMVGYDSLTEESVILYLQTGYYKGFSYNTLRKIRDEILRLGYGIKDMGILPEHLEQFKEDYLSKMVEWYVEEVSNSRDVVTNIIVRVTYEEYKSFVSKVYVPIVIEDYTLQLKRLLMEYKTIYRKYMRKVNKSGKEINVNIEKMIKEDITILEGYAKRVYRKRGYRWLLEKILRII